VLNVRAVRSPNAVLAVLVLAGVALGFKGWKEPPGVKSRLSKSDLAKKVRCDNPKGCHGTMKLEKGEYRCDTCTRTIAASDYSPPAKAE
jgi:hypothetical protein